MRSFGTLDEHHTLAGELQLVRFAGGLADHGSPVHVEDEFLLYLALVADERLGVDEQWVIGTDLEGDQLAPRQHCDAALALDGGGEQSLAADCAVQTHERGVSLQPRVERQQAAALDMQLFAREWYQCQLCGLERAVHRARPGHGHQAHPFPGDLALESTEQALAAQDCLLELHGTDVGNHATGDCQHLFLFQGDFQQSFRVDAECGHGNPSKAAMAGTDADPNSVCTFEHW